MRICLVSYEYPPDVGGEASYTQNLAIGLAELGNEVTVLLPPKEGVAYARSSNFEILKTGIRLRYPFRVGGFAMAAASVLPGMVRDRRLDLVHFTFDYPSVPIPLGGLGAPMVATIHHLHLTEALEARRALHGGFFALGGVVKGSYITFMERLLVRQAACAIAVSRFTAESAERHIDLAEARCRVVPNGINCVPFADGIDTGTLRGRFRLGAGPVLLYIGRIDKLKGLEQLMHAFARVRKTLPDLRLFLVGTGQEHYGRQLRNLASSFGLTEAMVFAGRIPSSEIPEAYALSTAVVLPSLMEGFGLSLLEAMAAGKPCIATRVGAVPELVKNGVNGILVQPGDSAGLAEAIVRVVSNRDAATEMGEAGRSLSAQYSLKSMTRETIEVYTKALNSWKSGGSVIYPNA